MRDLKATRSAMLGFKESLSDVSFEMGLPILLEVVRMCSRKTPAFRKLAELLIDLVVLGRTTLLSSKTCDLTFRSLKQVLG